MSKETERAGLALHFQTIAEPDLGELIAFPNQAFETPSDQFFVVFNIVDRGSVRRSLGYMKYTKRHFGTVQIDMYTPKNEGTKKSRDLADKWEALYDTINVMLTDGECCVFQTPSSRALATNEVRAANLDDNWDRYVFEAPFYRDQFVEK